MASQAYKSQPAPQQPSANVSTMPAADIPADRDLEALVIASIMESVTPELEIAKLEFMKPEMFSDPIYEAAFRALRAIEHDSIVKAGVFADASVRIDRELLMQYMRVIVPTIPAHTITSAINGLDPYAKGVINPPVVWAQLVERLALRRNLMDAANKIYAIAATPPRGYSAEAIIHYCNQAVFSAGSLSLSVADKRIGTAMGIYVQQYDLPHTEAPPCAFTGYAGVDRMITGLFPGEWGFLTAPTGMGKTAAILPIAIHNARMGNGVLFVSCELSRHEIARRTLAYLSGVPVTKLKAGVLTPDELTAIRAAAAVFETLPLFVEDEIHHPTPAQLQQTIRRYQYEHEIGLVLFDGIYSIRPDVIEDASLAKAAANPDLYWQFIADAFPEIAIKTNVCLLATHQNNRTAFGRTDNRPTLADIGKSSNLAARANFVLGMHRDSFFPPKKNRDRFGGMSIRNERITQIWALKVRDKPVESQLFAEIEYDPNRGGYLTSTIEADVPF